MKTQELTKNYDIIENNVLTLIGAMSDESLLMSVKIKLEHMRNIDDCKKKTRSDFVKGIVGFINWAKTKNISKSDLLITILHDVNEYLSNRNEGWFCPRTTGYIKYY